MKVLILGNQYIAVDIGASSGRLMLSGISDGKMTLKEVHRFKNGFRKVDGHDRWNIDLLIEEICCGLAKVRKMGIEEVTLGIDTWAVDYVLVGSDGRKLCDPVAYRDGRTRDAVAELTTRIPKKEIYKKTGIQFQNFNTLYQLYREDRELLKKTSMIMMIPDYIGYVLTGNAVTEVTNASTTQMMNLRHGLFDEDLLHEAGVKEEIFPPLVEAGTELGIIKEELRLEYDLPKTNVVTVATHDTASAVAGTPGRGHDWAFLSSGTWSLLGAELNVPETGSQAFNENYTNEWGAYGTYRFLKNIMGMWIVQCIHREYQGRYTFSELADMAGKVSPFRQFIDVNDERFMNPESMIDEIRNYCRETGQEVPETPGEIVMAVYSNLAMFYADQLHKLERILEEKIEVLNIVGGGSNVALLDQLTADLSGVRVVAGPGEATAIGNIIVSMISEGDLKNIEEGRQLIEDSFELKEYVPSPGKYREIMEKYQKATGGNDND